ncbi:histidine phosphatase superfamily [Schizophyllum amplum]|uniref:Histidine phosphatase superfamily n=1 Tax=Schizophyllum amplum TaxID=97359 RepID=A0A550CNN7_9AGAR|nr:histidine phosphatase superfamily [Auriculariopsis ampla]
MSTTRPMPRLFVIRHGETEWSLSGRHTGRTDIPLTARGIEQIKEKAEMLVGDGKMIDAEKLCTVLVSPRQRAHKTFHLLFEHVTAPPHMVTESVREWDYGDYEGLLPSEIKQKNPTFNIWTDGCPGGESVEQMCTRVDDVINMVRTYHQEYFTEGMNTRDVMIVAHGHFSRCLISRWLGMPLAFGTKLNVEAGGIAVLSYNHHRLEEPSINALNLYATVI